MTRTVPRDLKLRHLSVTNVDHLHIVKKGQCRRQNKQLSKHSQHTSSHVHAHVCTPFPSHTHLESHLKNTSCSSGRTMVISVCIEISEFPEISSQIFFLAFCIYVFTKVIQLLCLCNCHTLGYMGPYHIPKLKVIRKRKCVLIEFTLKNNTQPSSCLSLVWRHQLGLHIQA